MIRKKRNRIPPIIPMQLSNALRNPLMINSPSEERPLITSPFRQSEDIHRNLEYLVMSGLIVILVVVDVDNDVRVSWIYINNKQSCHMAFSLPLGYEWADEIKC